ncbi:uncharacterized protein LOC108596327 [Drosophila busckii]|uniref:uncharacterized protein LOC108596327 n=1 Tax=Drosophila busckii TaxID=30019 RepID=UPI00083EF0B5|nr:uncharacterized protein LOC108596327 [Drosophila busckii]
MANLENHLNFTQAEFINIDKERKVFSVHYNALRDAIYSNLKVEQPVGTWLNGHKLGGSYGDRLKITRPDEFDLVIYFKFPENDRIIVKADPQYPGNVKLDMTDVLKALEPQSKHAASFAKLRDITTANNLLIEDKLQNLITGAVSRALTKMENKIVVEGQATKIVYKRCGPAHTMFINHGNIKYSVDFVPAIRLNAKQNVLGVEQLRYFKNIAYWDAIPKPMKPAQANNVSFRASYYEAESVMIKDKNKLKDCIKLMKKFRDSKQNMNNLKSYYIKTLLLWEIKQRPESYWRSQRLNDMVLEMFIILSDRLKPGDKKAKLLFFWDPKLDLFACFTETQRKEMFNCVSKQIYTLRRSAGNMTDDFTNNVTSSFSTKAERFGLSKL